MVVLHRRRRTSSSFGAFGLVSDRRLEVAPTRLLQPRNTVTLALLKMHTRYTRGGVMQRGGRGRGRPTDGVRATAVSHRVVSRCRDPSARPVWPPHRPYVVDTHTTHGGVNVNFLCLSVSAESLHFFSPAGSKRETSSRFHATTLPHALLHPIAPIRDWHLSQTHTPHTHSHPGNQQPSDSPQPACRPRVRKRPRR